MEFTRRRNFLREIKMSVDFVNLYIEKLLHEVTELTKTKILLSTQITLLENINKELENKVKELESNSSKKTKRVNSEKDEF